MNHSESAKNLFNKRATEYQEKFMDVGLYAESLDEFCKLLKPQAKVLELACGPGNISKYLLDKRPDLDLLGIDFAPNMIALAKQNNPNAKFEVMDARKISSFNQKFDGILCGFCLPYLNKEEALQLISDASKLLHSQGILYLSTMEDTYNKSGIQTSSQGDHLFMYFHEKDYLSNALIQSKFTITSSKLQEYPGANNTIDLILIATKTP